MRIDISKLSENRELELSEEWDAQALDLNVPGWQYSGPLKVSVRAKKDSGIAKLKVSIQAPVSLVCSRCSKDFTENFEKTFDLAYPLDLSGTAIEIDDHIREELILNYPAKILCRDDCKGLCLRCGADLNEEKCRCKVS